MSDKYSRTGPIGLPGGPCHVIRNIEDENLPPRLRDQLIEDVEKGKDLSNQQADIIYDRETIPTKSKLFSKLVLTAHAMYRMDLRGITVPEVQKVLTSFAIWVATKTRDTRRMKPKDQQMLEAMSQGRPIRFEDPKTGITLIFVLDTQRKEARVVSTWWSHQSNPPKVKPGQCDYIPYLDDARGETNRPAILGSLMSKAAALASYVVEACDCDDDDEDYDDDYEDYDEDDDEDFVEGVSKGRRRHNRRPVNPKNRQKNKSRRKDYARNPSRRRQRRKKQKKYDRSGRGKARKRQWQRKNKNRKRR